MMNGHTVGSAYFLTFLHVKVKDLSEKQFFCMLKCELATIDQCLAQTLCF